MRYWAAARAAAGRDTDVVAPGSLREVLAAVLRVHEEGPDPRRFADVLAACSLLLDDTPVSTSDPATVTVRDGQTVECLPPFAGG